MRDDKPISGARKTTSLPAAKNHICLSLVAFIIMLGALLGGSAPPESVAIRAMYTLSALIGALALAPVWLVIVRPFENSILRGFAARIVGTFDFMLKIPPSKGYYKFEDFIATLEGSPAGSAARSTASIVREARRAVLARTLIPGSEPFERLMEELRKDEFPVGERHYQILKYREFVKVFGLIALSILIACVSINISVHSLSPTENFNFSTRGNSLIQMTVNAFYFSVATISTVGYGDLNPGSGMLARIAIMLEIATSFIFVVFGLSFGVSLLQVFHVDCDDLTETLRDDLKSFSETGLTVEAVGP